MVKVIPARIENGQIIPEVPLPVANVRSVAILLELEEVKPLVPQESTLPTLLGIVTETTDPKEDYIQYLVEKYQ